MKKKRILLAFVIHFRKDKRATFFQKMTDPVQKDIRNLETGQDYLRKGQDTIMEILDELAGKQDRFDLKLDHMEGRLDQTDKKLDKMMGHLDFVVGELQRKRTEELATSHLVGQFGQQLTDHDKRITKLEKAAA